MIQKLTLTCRAVPLLVLVLIFSFGFMAIYFGVLINITPSMKFGVYIKSNGMIDRGDIVAFCLPEPYKTRGLDALYIQKGRKCIGSDPLIKEVIAVPGDQVILHDRYLEVNGNRNFYETLRQDSEGHTLTAFPRGSYANTKGYWMIGTHSKNSWDSRYWGAVGKEQILYKLRPLITW